MYPDKADLAKCADILDDFTYADDATWAAIQARGQGNCKNFAAGKKVWLHERGWPVSALALAIWRVEPAARKLDARGLEILHANLVVTMPDGEQYALDQRFPERVLALEELHRIGYEGVQIQNAASPTGWSELELA